MFTCKRVDGRAIFERHEKALYVGEVALFSRWHDALLFHVMLFLCFMRTAETVLPAEGQEEVTPHW